MKHWKKLLFPALFLCLPVFAACQKKPHDKKAFPTAPIIPGTVAPIDSGASPSPAPTPKLGLPTPKPARAAVAEIPDEQNAAANLLAPFAKKGTLEKSGTWLGLTWEFYNDAGSRVCYISGTQNKSLFETVKDDYGSYEALRENYKEGSPYENKPWDTTGVPYKMVIENGTVFTDAKGLFARYSGYFPDYDLSEVIVGNIRITERCAEMFEEQQNLRIPGRIYTAGVTDMSFMFYGCENLTSLDLSGFDTSSCTNMLGMFWYCHNLGDLDFSTFQTSQVTNMSCMFDFCSSLKSLDLSTFDTSAVTDFSGMFDNCTQLESLTLANFDTSAAQDFSFMFNECRKLKSLETGYFRTPQATDMSFLFTNCASLSELDTGNFDTACVANMYRMFAGCKEIVTLDLRHFKTSATTSMREMFAGCEKLFTLNLTSFTIESLTDMRDMFRECNIGRFLCTSEDIKDNYAARRKK